MAYSSMRSYDRTGASRPRRRRRASLLRAARPTTRSAPSPRGARPHPRSSHDRRTSRTLARALRPGVDEPGRRAPTLHGEDRPLDALLERSQRPLAPLRSDRPDVRTSRTDRGGGSGPDLHLLGLKQDPRRSAESDQSPLRGTRPAASPARAETAGRRSDETLACRIWARASGLTQRASRCAAGQHDRPTQTDATDVGCCPVLPA